VNEQDEHQPGWPVWASTPAKRARNVAQQQERNRKIREQQERRGTVCFDFDGTLTEGAEYTPDIGHVDVGGIRRAQAMGYSVAIMTCSPARHVVRALERAGIEAHADQEMVFASWHERRAVLVTQRKVCAVAYFDDRAHQFRYGQDWERAFERAGLSS